MYSLILRNSFQCLEKYLSMTGGSIDGNGTGAVTNGTHKVKQMMLPRLNKSPLTEIWAYEKESVMSTRQKAAAHQKLADATTSNQDADGTTLSTED